MKKRIDVKKLVLASILLAFAIVLQVVQKNFTQINPLLIGPLICTVIMLTTYMCGLKYGLLVGILIPVTAVPIGALAAPLIPFAPFIILGNLALAASFAPFMKKGKFGLYLAVLISTVIKFLVLAFCATKVIYWFDLGFSDAIYTKIGAAFTTPQLIVTFLGGVVVIILIKVFQKAKIIAPAPAPVKKQGISGSRID